MNVRDSWQAKQRIQDSFQENCKVWVEKQRFVDKDTSTCPIGRKISSNYWVALNWG